MEKPQTLLVFGKSGQLARALAKRAPEHARFTLKMLDRRDADFLRPESVAAAVRAAGDINLVINATAYTAVDKAQSDRDAAHTVNASSVRALAHACAAQGLPLIHVSTDYVYDGRRAEPYVESDATNPLSVYGQTKLDGEDAVRAVLNEHVIIRTSWIYSAQGSNFVKTMLRLGAEREELRIVDDQHGAPTSADNLADCLLSIAERIGGGHATFGTFHFTAAGETTWNGFARAIFAAAPWAAIRARTVPIPSSQYPVPAERPKNSRLDCARIGQCYGIVQQPWQDSLVRVMAELELEHRGERP